MRVAWVPRARADLRAISEHIAADDLSAALRVADRIYNLAKRLADHPQLGRPGRLAGSRELVVSGSPYLVVYRIRAADVEIIRIIHGAQNWPPE